MRIKVWDLPVRLCHWLLAAAVAGSIVTVNLGWMQWHERCGFAAATLVVFRVLWGLMGSDTARFAQFVRGPGTILAYLGGRWQGIGHNPLGALSVLALLGLVLAQVGTGLFSNDDIIYFAPWAYWAGESLSGRLSGWHTFMEPVVYGLIALHLAAVAFYSFVKRQRIVPAMVTGYAEAPGLDVRVPRLRHPALALPVLAVAVALTGTAFRYWIA